MNKIKKYIAVILSSIMLLGCFSQGALAFTMPEGVSEEQIASVMPKVALVIEKLMSISEDTADLGSKIYETLFSDETLNGIFKSVYSAFSEQASTLSTLGVDLSVSGVMAGLSSYPEVQAALQNKSTWEEVFAGEFSPSWNVGSKQGFEDALASMLSPLNELLFTLLCSGTYRMNLFVSVQGANGYENAVIQILRAVGAPRIMTQSEFTAAAQQNRKAMIINTISMLFDAVDNIIADPVNNLSLYLPSIAYFLENDGLSSALKTLLEPMKIRVAIFSLSGVDQLLENLDAFSSSSDLTALLEDMDMSSFLGEGTELKLPEIDLAAFSQCTSFANGEYITNKYQSFIVIMRYLIDAVKLNADSLSELTGQDLSGAGDVLSRFLARDTDSIIKMIVDLLSLTASDTVLEYMWSYPEYTAGEVQFTANLTRENYEKMLSEIDGTLNQFLDEFTDSGTLSQILSVRIYSNSLISELIKGVYGALYSDETGAALSMLGLDASPEGVANSISSSYPAAANAIKKAGSWDKLNTAAINWGFANGDKQGFSRALTAVLTPFTPFLTLLLAEGKINVLGAVEISGSNGYNTAVIPLLEALGCDTALIKTYAEYKSTANTSAAITDILTPVTALLDALIEKPVETLCAILPNMVYFINSDGLSKCVDNLLYPVKVLLKTIGAEDLLGNELTAVADIDISEIMNGVLSSSELNLSLPEPDLALLSSLGTAETRESKRTYNGGFQNYTYIVSDAPAVLITVLRFVLGSLSNGENSFTLSSLMSADGSQEGDMFAMYTGKVTEQLAAMTTDETIEWLYNLLFAETPKREQEVTDDNIPTIIYAARENNTRRNLTAAIIIIVVLIVVLSVGLSRVDIGAYRERKKHKKLKKKREKELIKQQIKTKREGK
ncbi:MAG: hypothetical protein J1E34_08635 [Oscillospiraceae bacterium]|nr:hypothetical protein [Oscillospiraceae bacterium]